MHADALQTIAQLHALTNLNIGSCEDVMDEGLQALAVLSDLDSLVAVDCRLTDEGVASLQKVSVHAMRTACLGSIQWCCAPSLNCLHPSDAPSCI